MVKPAAIRCAMLNQRRRTQRIPTMPIQPAALTATACKSPPARYPPTCGVFDSAPLRHLLSWVMPVARRFTTQ
jgi:hypothetical protein